MFFAFVAIAFAAGCAKPPAAYLIPMGEALALDDPRIDRVLMAHQARVEARTGLRGSARVVLTGPDFKLNRPQRIVVQRPDRLRFEILGLFDQLAAVLVADGERYGFYDVSTGDMRRGRVSASLLWDLTKIDLTPAEVVGLLLGAPRPEQGTLRAGAWRSPDGGLAIAFGWPTGGLAIACAAEDPWGVFFAPTCFLRERTLLDMGGQLFLFDAQDRLTEIRALEPGGELRYHAIYEDYEVLGGGSEDEGGVNFPKRVTLSSPSLGSEARFAWKRVMLADDLPDRIFEIPAPRHRGAGS